MDNRLTAKLFHTIVVLGVGLTVAGCGDDDSSNTGKTQQQGQGTSSGTVAQNTSSSSTSSGTTAGTSGAPTGSTTSSTSGSSTAGWVCCG